MNSKLLFCFLMISFYSYSQVPIDVTEKTFKIAPSGEETFYFGFAEGDVMIFNFEEMNGKELKEIEITEMPTSSKFMDYKSKKIENKSISIINTGIYKFHFVNSSVLAGRICKVKIQRIPSSPDRKNFNTNVYNGFKNDTTYYNQTEKVLIKADTIITELTNQVAKVHSVSNMSGNKTSFNFTLPNNTISWSYYIGVDQAGQQAYDKATKELSSNSILSSKLAGYNPLAAVALNLTSYLPLIQGGEDIDFYIVPGENVNLFLTGKQFNYLKKGKVINDFSKMTPVDGILHMCLLNDNAITSVSVTVKILAVSVKSIWENQIVRKVNISSRPEMYLKN